MAIGIVYYIFSSRPISIFWPLRQFETCVRGDRGREAILVQYYNTAPTAVYYDDNNACAAGNNSAAARGVPIPVGGYFSTSISRITDPVVSCLPVPTHDTSALAVNVLFARVHCTTMNYVRRRRCRSELPRPEENVRFLTPIIQLI